MKFKIFMLIVLYSASAYPVEPMKLNSPILPLVDGIRGVMDEHSVHKIKYMYQQINIFQNGNIDRQNKTRIPQHKFENKYYTLLGLINLENQIKSAQEKSKLQTLLVKLREDFLDLTRPFQKDAKGTQHQMYKLIKTFCEQRKRPDSILLDWATTQDDDESFRTKVTSFKILSGFCDDLLTFYVDLLYSCPKAMKLFKEKYKNNRLAP